MPIYKLLVTVSYEITRKATAVCWGELEETDNCEDIDIDGRLKRGISGGFL
jgi:hypothetical protein